MQPAARWERGRKPSAADDSDLTNDLLIGCRRLRSRRSSVQQKHCVDPAALHIGFQGTERRSAFLCAADAMVDVLGDYLPAAGGIAVELEELILGLLVY